MSSIRSNPPSSVASWRVGEKYKVIYDDITNQGVSLQYHDRHMLAELACTLVDMEMMREDIELNGTMMEVQGDRNKVMKRNPCVDVLQKLQPIAVRLMKEFKMSPQSRGNDSVNPLENGGNNEDGFNDI